ncbi:MAG TPA: biopolymer transporter ExbD [Verrucomicrobiae bacterium]|jgi:biopolymer transport protein ExbD|nr:biopolymer transporter ExbD [Verrucomicrobiae bacterium]
MQFIARRRRATPTVIIISLIDVLIVVLIFLMVTTAFKQQPAVRLALPESKQAKAGAMDNALVVTISKQGPLYLKTEPVTLDALKQRLLDAVAQNKDVTLAIRADTDAPWGQVVRVMDVAKSANIRVASAFTKAAGP